MNILLDSVYDRSGVCPVYDEPGACPKCGSPMRAIRLYRADTRTYGLSSSKNYRAGRWVTTTTYATNYDNIQPCALGFCEACYREEQERLQAEQGRTPPSPAKWVAGAILAAVGTALIVRSILLNEHEVGPLLAFAFAAFAAGLYLFFKDIGSYRKKRQEHLRYKAGVRDYSPMSESAVASVLTARTPNTAYLTDQGLQELRAKSGPMGLL